MTVPMYRLVRSSRVHGSRLYPEFCATPAIAGGCSAWRYRVRRPASHMIGSSWIYQLTEPGPKRPTSVTGAQALAARAQSPEGDLGLVDLVPDRGVRVEARRAADRAVDVGDDAAGPAHHMVVVVPAARLVPRGRAGRLDPPGQPGPGQGAEHVVDGLGGDRVEAGPRPRRGSVPPPGGAPREDAPGSQRAAGPPAGPARETPLPRRPYASF